MYNYKQLKNNIQSIYLPISGVNLPLKKLQERGNQYVDLSPFLKFLGYKISIIKNNAVLKKGNQVYSFKHLSDVVRINVENSVVKKTIQSAPIIRNQTFFVNIHSFLNDLGYSYILKNNQLIILRKLHFIELSNNDIILSKNSQINLGRGNRLSSPPRLFWDLPYTHCPSNKSTQTTAKITKISFGQNGTTCRMVFHLNSHQIAQIEKISKTKSKIQLIRTQYKQPTIAKRKSKSLKGKVIIIDPGHGGSDPGAVAKNKDYEKNYTLDISKRIKKHLELTRSKSNFIKEK